MPRRTAADNVLGDKTFNVAKNPKYDDAYQTGLTCMVYTFFNKKTPDGVFESKIMSTQRLDEELHKSIITNLEKRKVYSSFTDNVWGDDLADMHLINKFNKEFQFLLCVIDIYSKYG